MLLCATLNLLSVHRDNLVPVIYLWDMNYKWTNVIIIYYYVSEYISHKSLPVGGCVFTLN